MAKICLTAITKQVRQIITCYIDCHDCRLHQCDQTHHLADERAVILLSTHSLRYVERQLKPRILTCIIILAALWSVITRAQPVELSGQASGWSTVTKDDWRLGLRYIPELSLNQSLTDDLVFDFEAATDAHWFAQYDGSEYLEGDAEVELYRLWGRVASPQLELRLGLQKLSFGPATLLRSLMWFDTLDPRDPLSLTDGVYALLGRYYFLNNANIWLWALYGNDELRGRETLPADKHNVEFGGRVQLPVGPGEAGLSYHQRRVDPSGTWLTAAYPKQKPFVEQRIGLDGKWDVGVGLWFEATLTQQDFELPEPCYERLLSIGVDYTFAIGNGPHLLFEQFLRSQSDTAFESGSSQSISALSMDYPLTLLDTVSVITYHDWDSRDWTHFLAWRRTYDRWQLQISGFWGPDQASATRDSAGAASYSGKGIQIMLVLNH